MMEKPLIPSKNLDVVNQVLANTDIGALRDLSAVVARYGTPAEINQKAVRARELPRLMKRLEAQRPEYVEELKWLMAMRDKGAFISMDAYRRKVLGAGAAEVDFCEASAVTLELSSVSYFPWLMQLARRALKEGELVPARIIRVRNMQEQAADGDLAACVAACQIMGASQVEQPDTRGVDGSNIHLGGPDTLVGYFGGVGQPNDHPLKWLDECLYYYTTYGIPQVLNLNNGTILIAYLLYRMGIDLKFKISVTLGNDNPFSALWTLLAARLFAREDGSTPLEGFNWSNSVTVATIVSAAEIRRALGLEKQVRFEHHVTETFKGVVIQPYNRREDVVELAGRVPNLSAKHEGGDPECESRRARPSDMFDYYKPLTQIRSEGIMDAMSESFMDKYESMCKTARALTARGHAVLAAPGLHR